MNWRSRLRREFLEADREFVEEVLPVGTVDRAAFGLLADATRYLLVEEGGEVHLRAEIAACGEILRSLAESGLVVREADAQAAVAKFAALWEAKARARGTWAEAVEAARAAGEIEALRPPERRSLLARLLRRR